MYSHLAGRVALVTGSTSGIGLGVAQALASVGVNVVLNGFGNAQQIEAVKQEMIDRHRVRVLYDAADMTSPS